MEFTLVLVRHGESEANVKHMLSGCMDVPLTERGRIELEDLRKNVDYPVCDRYYCSPLQRCRDTFHILFPDRTPIVRDCFREIDFRSLEGWILSTKDEIDAYFASWVADEPYLDEETFGDVASRAKPAILGTVRECLAEGLSSATIVMHSGIMRTALIALFCQPKEDFLTMSVPNGLGYVVTFDDDRPVSYKVLLRRDGSSCKGAGIG